METHGCIRLYYQLIRIPWQLTSAASEQAEPTRRPYRSHHRHSPKASRLATCPMEPVDARSCIVIARREPSVIWRRLAQLLFAFRFVRFK